MARILIQEHVIASYKSVKLALLFRTLTRTHGKATYKFVKLARLCLVCVTTISVCLSILSTDLNIFSQKILNWHAMSICCKTIYYLVFYIPILSFRSPGNSLSRIINGQDSSIADHPHQISLQYLSGGQWYHICGGSILAETWIITAAHCVETAT